MIAINRYGAFEILDFVQPCLVVGVDLTGTPIVCRHYITLGGRV